MFWKWIPSLFQRLAQIFYHQNRQFQFIALPRWLPVLEGPNILRWTIIFALKLVLETSCCSLMLLSDVSLFLFFSVSSIKPTIIFRLKKVTLNKPKSHESVLISFDFFFHIRICPSFSKLSAIFYLRFLM